MRIVSLLITVTMTAAALWLVWPYIEPFVAKALVNWAMMGLVLACLLPWLLVEVYFARPFDVTAYADSVDYEFASEEYALDFYFLNRDAEWVKMSGPAMKIKNGDI